MDIKAVSDQNKGRDRKCVTQPVVWLLQLAVTDCNKWWFSQVMENAQNGVARECRSYCSRSTGVQKRVNPEVRRKKTPTKGQHLQAGAWAVSL